MRHQPQAVGPRQWILKRRLLYLQFFSCSKSSDICLRHYLSPWQSWFQLSHLKTAAGLQRSMLASTPHLAHSEQLPVRTWVSLMLCSEIPEYSTGHPGNNLGDKGSKALHDCYWVIQNFFSHSQSSTHPARHFPLSFRKKEGSSITDRQWELIHLDFLPPFFKKW